jgi:tetraacyldisaccharide 4'-kinase
VLLKILLLPFGILFGLIMHVRRALYDLGILKRYTSEIPAIVIGNLNVGGSGKTPHLIFLANLLQTDGIVINSLSRGYGRKTKGFLEVNENSTPEEVGDEPLLIKQKLPESKVFVCENRPDAIRKIMKISRQPVLLDDAFQHLSLKAGFYILLSSYHSPFYIDFPLPAGRLREFRIASKSADMIFITKCPIGLTEEDKQAITAQVRRYSNATLMFTHHAQSFPVNSFSNKAMSRYTSVIFLLTGIANPKPLKSFLISEFSEATFKNFQFKDHHAYTESEIFQIQEEAKKCKACIVTTEKDWVKIKQMKTVTENPDLWFLSPVTVSCDKQTEDKLLSTIQNFLINFAN